MNLESHYPYDMSSLATTTANIREGFNSAVDFTIQHNQLPDVLVRHMPEMSFISFVSNFGGLLGMWLGLSVLIIFDNIFSFTKRIIKAIGKRDNDKILFKYNQNNIIATSINVNVMNSN